MLGPDQLRTLLRQRTPLILDGGLATELERRGHDISGPLWSGHVLLEAPGEIERLHRDYVRAGADVLTTASYQITPRGMIDAGFTPEDAVAAIRRSVEIAVGARDRARVHRTDSTGLPLVAASIGPYGAYLHDGSEYRGDYDLSVDELVEFHRERFELLADSEADCLAFETTPSLDEARAYLRLLEERPEVSAWLSFSCRDDAHTSRGEPIAECAREVAAAPGVVLVGVNCVPVRSVTPLLRAMRGATTAPLIVYPNSGESWDAETGCWSGDRDEDSLAARAPAWIEEGAAVIGGCCRIGPEPIAALRRACTM